MLQVKILFRFFFGCKYSRWMQRCELFTYWSAREETDAGVRGRENENEKGKKEEDKTLLSGVGGGFRSKL